MNQKKDFLLSAIAGEFVSWFLIFIAFNPLIPELKTIEKLGPLIWLLPIILPIIFVLGILIGKVLSGFSGIFLQLAKYGEIGVLNTAIDFGILNFLMWLTSTTKGFFLIPLNLVSFSTAVTNSYFWNKWWTFEKKGALEGREFAIFLIVSLIGIGINTLIVFLGTSFFEAPLNLSGGAWANLVKIVATSLSLVWNFTGYKFIVFKK